MIKGRADFFSFKLLPVFVWLSLLKWFNDLNIFQHDSQPIDNSFSHHFCSVRSERFTMLLQRSGRLSLWNLHSRIESLRCESKTRMFQGSSYQWKSNNTGFHRLFLFQWFQSQFTKIFVQKIQHKLSVHIFFIPESRTKSKYSEFL